MRKESLSFNFFANGHKAVFRMALPGPGHRSDVIEQLSLERKLVTRRVKVKTQTSESYEL